MMLCNCTKEKQFVSNIQNKAIVFNEMVSIYGTPLGLVDESQNILLTVPNESF